MFYLTRGSIQHLFLFACSILSIFSSCANSSHEGVCIESHQLCSKHIPIQLQAAQDSAIRVWSILDVLRSITIEPRDRVRFARQMLDDMLVLLTDLNGLSSSCLYCSSYCSDRHEDILYLEELLIYLSDAFRSVFESISSGEEHALNLILGKIVVVMDEFKNRFQFASHI